MIALVTSLATLVQANGSDVQAVDTPSIDWSALWPGLILVLGAILLITIASLAKRWLFPGFYALWTVLTGLGAIAAAIPLWNEVRDGDGPARQRAGMPFPLGAFERRIGPAAAAAGAPVLEGLQPGGAAGAGRHDERHQEQRDRAIHRRWRRE